MSEPSALVVQCQIGLDNLRECLAAREPVFSAWSDWDKLDIEVWEDIPLLQQPDTAPTLDQQTSSDLGSLLAEMRNYAESPVDWYCAYDQETETLTIGQLLFSENWLEYLTTLTKLRRLGNYITDGQAGGRIVIYQWLFDDPHLDAQIALTPGESAVVPAGDDDTEVNEFVSSIVEPLHQALQEEEDSDEEMGPLRDDLDWLLAVE